jgi:hypothetical protein
MIRFRLVFYDRVGSSVADLDSSNSDPDSAFERNTDTDPDAGFS